MTSPSALPRFDPAKPPRPELEPPRTGRRWFPWLLALAAAAGAGWFAWRQRESARVVPAPTPRQTATVRAGGIARTLRVSGYISASKRATFVAPKMRGVRTASSSISRLSRGPSSSSDFRLILQMVAEPGQRVRAGDPVAEFDKQYMTERLDDYRADVHQRRLYNQRINAATDIRRNSLDHRIRVGRAAVDKAELNLRTIPVRSQIQAERFRLAHEEAKARLENLLIQRKYFDQSERSQLRREELDLQHMRREEQRSEANVRQLAFRSPIDGIVLMGETTRGGEQHEIEAGDEVRAGHAFMQVVDLRSQYFEGLANQADEQSLRPGQRAVIRLDSVPGVELPGRVTTLGALAQGNRYRPDWVRGLRIRVVPDRFDARAIPNLSASAEVVLESAAAAAVIPRGCIAAGGSVQVRRGEGEQQTWERRQVELGIMNHVEASVRSGLRAGDVIACGDAPAR